MCTKLFLRPASQVVHDCHLVLRGTKPHPNWALYGKDNGTYIGATHGPPPKVSNAKLTKNPT